jgi:hypothetical protein
MRLLTPFLTVTLMAGLALGSPAFAEQEVREDEVVLTDGRTITGSIVGEDDDYVSIRSGGVLRAYPKDRVSSITRAERPAPASDPGTERPTVEEPASGEAPSKKQARKQRKAERARAGADVAPLGREAEAWMVELLNRMQSPAAKDPVVRRSLGAALRSLGPAAAPAIREAAAGAPAVVGATLRQIADAIEKEARKKAQKRDDATSDRGPSDAPGIDGRRRDVIAELGLSKEQAKEARMALRDHIQARREIGMEARAAGTPREEVMAELADLRTRTSETLRALLDEEQARRFDELAPELFRMVEQRARRGAPGGNKQKKAKKDDEPATGDG